MDRTAADHYAQLWDLRDLVPLAETATSQLWRGHGQSGEVVLKLLLPGAEDERPGAEMLRYWHGLGAVRLLAAEDMALLIDHLPGPSLGDLSREGRDPEAAGHLASVLRLLHRPRNFAPEGLRPLADWLSPLTHGSPQGWPGHSSSDMMMAARLAGKLLASAEGHIPLHGDLHHDNVLWSGSDWKAIDPKGLIGDPTFDTAMSLRNPVGAELLARRYDRIEALSRKLSETTGYPQRRILGWGAVQSALSAIWNREAAQDCSHDLALLPRLLSAYATAD